jgi:hypothetical protein
MHDDRRMEVLNQLEAGEINAEQALQALGEELQGALEEELPAARPLKQGDWRQWWLIPFALGIAGTAAGLGLSQVGGWWWACAGPLLILSLTVVIVTATTSHSTWVYARILAGAKVGFRRIHLHFPLPLRLTAWTLRIFGGYIPGLERTVVDELIMSLDEDISRETPVHIEIHDGEGGDHVEIFVG